MYYTYNNIDSNKIMGSIVNLNSVNYKINPLGTSTLKEGSKVKVDYISLDLAFVTEVCSGLQYEISTEDLGEIITNNDYNELPLENENGKSVHSNYQLLSLNYKEEDKNKIKAEIGGKTFLVDKRKVDEFLSTDNNCTDDDTVDVNKLYSFTEDEIYNGYKLKEKLKTNNEIEKKALEITKNCKTDKEKAEAIYLWISKNIKYDNDLLKSCNFTKNEAIDTFKNKKGICLGYSSLFCAMCKSVGLHSQLIKGNLYDDDDKLGGHAWNRVLINNRYVGVDCTLSAGLYEELNYRNDNINKILLEAFQDVRIKGNKIKVINTDDYFDSKFFYKSHKNGVVIYQN